MSGDGSYTWFYDSLGESPSYTSLSAHTLFSRQNFPACASACFASTDLGGCSATDYACLCNSEAFLSRITSCTEQTCTGSDLTAAITACQQLCLTVGVTLHADPTGSTTTTGPSSPATKSVASSFSSPASSSSHPAPSSSSLVSSSGGSGTLTTSAIPSSTASNSANGRSNIMIGPIVGGVVGFLALVAFVVVGLIWFCKSRRRRGIWVGRFPSDFSLTSAEQSLVLPSFPVEPFPISSAASQNSRRVQSRNKPTSSGGPFASPSMKQVEPTRSLIPTTTQTPSPVLMSSSSAGTPIGGLYSHAMVGSGSRIVLHQDSGIWLPRQAGGMRWLWRCRRCIRPAEEVKVESAAETQD